MFIQVQTTPNPNTLKFIPNVQLLPYGVVMNFTTTDSCANSILAKALMAIGPEITGVMLAYDFVAVTKNEASNWDSLKTLVFAEITDCLTSGLDIVNQEAIAKIQNEQENGEINAESSNRASQTEQTEDEQLNQQIVKQIVEILNIKVRPSVAQDGGDIEFVEFREGVVYLQLKGACHGCPSSTYTLKNGIENMLKHYIPEVLEVRQV